MREDNPPVGTVLAGQYRLTEVIGEGPIDESDQVPTQSWSMPPKEIPSSGPLLDVPANSASLLPMVGGKADSILPESITVPIEFEPPVESVSSPPLELFLDEPRPETSTLIGDRPISKRTKLIALSVAVAVLIAIAAILLSGPDALDEPIEDSRTVLPQPVHDPAREEKATRTPQPARLAVKSPPKPASKAPPPSSDNGAISSERSIDLERQLERATAKILPSTATSTAASD